MLNIFSLICINSALYSSSISFAKLSEADALSPIVYVGHPFTLVSISLCLASYCNFSMRLQYSK